MDCYRFYPDAYEALAQASGLRLRYAHPLLESRYNPVAAGFKARPNVPVSPKFFRRTLAVAPTLDNLGAALSLAPIAP